MRVGIDTADWDHDRKSGIKHAKPPVAHSFPAFWRSYGKTFEGHTYVTRLSFSDSKSRPIVGIKLSPSIPEAGYTIEQIKLVDGQSKSESVATLARRNNFTLAYLSDTVAIWKNDNAMPRVHCSLRRDYE
jgi:hypothetical protein